MLNVRTADGAILSTVEMMGDIWQAVAVLAIRLATIGRFTTLNLSGQGLVAFPNGMLS